MHFAQVALGVIEVREKHALGGDDFVGRAILVIVHREFCVVGAPQRLVRKFLGLELRFLELVEQVEVVHVDLGALVELGTAEVAFYAVGGNRRVANGGG